MFRWIAQLFDTSGFPDRWHCGVWSDVHGWTHIVADMAIFGAYVAIPIALGYFVRRRTDVPFPKIFWLFSAFILFCGCSHLIEATIFWQPWYRFSALVKVCTAIVSWATVIAIVPVIPQAMKFRSPADLENEVANRTLQLKELNQLLQGKNSELEQFIYTVSHDLKSPLVTTRGFLGALKEDLQHSTDASVSDSIERIDRATLRMGELLEDLLELSRIGQVRNQPEWVSVEAVISEMQKNIPPEQKKCGIAIRVSGRLPRVFADQLRVQQVFDNLIANALKYGTTESNRIVTVSGQETSNGVEYRVTDHGSGIEPKFRGRIFLPFERLSIDDDGTGIGLAIVSRIVSLNGGSVAFEETPGGGSTFVVKFPHPR